jgi:hypothetical protein
MELQEVTDLFKQYGATAVTQRDNGVFVVEGNVSVASMEMAELPFIGVGAYEVTGDFRCEYNQLTSLEGAPQSVGQYFWCDHNQLTSLEGAPQSVGRDFGCNHNQLSSLKGAPHSVGGNFRCNHNQLASLEGAPQSVGLELWCEGNPIISLDGLPVGFDLTKLQGADAAKALLAQSRSLEALDGITVAPELQAR